MQHSRSLSQYSDGTLYDSPPASAPISPNETEWPESGLKNQGKFFGSQRLLPSVKPAQVWIPAVRKGEDEAKRTLVLCFDGTGDQFDSDVSSRFSIVASLLNNPPDLSRIQTSFNWCLCYVRTTHRDSSFIIRFVERFSLASSEHGVDSLNAQAGIGTYTTVHLPVISTASEMLDEMLATNLSMHVKCTFLPLTP